IPKAYSDAISANANAINSLSNSVTQQGNAITSNSSSITSLTNQIGNTKSYSLVTFRNSSAVGMPKAAGVFTGNNTRLYGFGRGLNLIVFKNGDVESCTQYDTYGDIVSACNAIYAAIKALASGTYFAIVGTDNIGSVGNSNPNTDLRALLLACGAGDTYFRSWNWNALPIFVGRKDLDAGNGILGMFDSTVPNQWIEYPLSFVNGVPVGLGDSRTLTTQLDANASAISSLSNTVTQQGKDIASHSSSITSLNNSITNINGTLATKADSSALTNLANRVTTTEGAITSQGSSITSLNASVNGLLKDVAVSDTRSTNQPPSWYWSNYPLRIVREFKRASVLGLTGMGTYVSLETYVYWTDASGGPIIQIARGTDSKLTAERRSTSTSTWGTWVQDIKAISDGLANKAEASALSSLDSKVSVIDGKVSTQASSITTLQTTVGGNTASIQSQQQSIDGLKARATLKLQSGNLVGGVGIENDSKTVDFIIQANKFAIGAPSDVTSAVTPKYAFTYQSTPTTLPNGTVIPAGLYLDSASISYINANKIYADSLSAISANLGTFTSLADQSKPNGARTVISGERIEVYDENNVMRVRIGRW
ncbi:phage tail protein, partial [Acinetobacter baumannii]|nr:phage tail protein [Acinetobacter baumannii]